MENLIRRGLESVKVSTDSLLAMENAAFCLGRSYQPFADLGTESSSALMTPADVSLS